MKTRRDLDNRGRPLVGTEQNPNEWKIERIRYVDNGVMIRYQSARKEDPAARYVVEFSADELDLILASRKRGRQRTLSEDDASRIRDMYATTSCSMERLAQRYGVSQGLIQHVIDRKGAYS